MQIWPPARFPSRASACAVSSRPSPHDLTLRRRLAEVYRLYGDAAEAGRWMYLEEDRYAEETAAFEARHRSPPVRG